MQVEAQKFTKSTHESSPKGKSLKTKCSENFFVSDNIEDSEESDEDVPDENCSVDSEGGIKAMQKYVYSKNILTKNKTYNGTEPIPLDLKAYNARAKWTNKFVMRNFKKFDEFKQSRNQVPDPSIGSFGLNFSRSKEL